MWENTKSFFSLVCTCLSEGKSGCRRVLRSAGMKLRATPGHSTQTTFIQVGKRCLRVFVTLRLRESRLGPGSKLTSENLHAWVVGRLRLEAEERPTFNATSTGMRGAIGVSRVSHHNIGLFNCNDSTSKTRVVKIVIRLNGGRPRPTFQTRPLQ